MGRFINNSIATKLVFLLVSASFVVLMIFAFTVQYAIKNHFYDQDYMHLETKLIPLLPNIEDRIDSLSTWSIFAWILDNGKIVKVNNAEAELPLNVAFESDYKWTAGDRTFQAFKFKYPEVQDREIVLAMDVTHHMVFFDNLNSILIWALLLTISLSGAYSLLIVSNGLAPIKELNKYVDQVNTSNLSIRIPENSFPKELRELALAQNEMLERLQAGHLRLSEFSSDIAHELRTPLNNIMTQTHVALGVKRSATEYQDILSSNIEELERLNKTISDTLYLAKSENELLNSKKQSLVLRDLVVPLIEYYEALADEKNVRILLYGDTVQTGDKEMLQRAFGNVLSNALRHCFSDTDISIFISGSDKGNIVKISNVGELIPPDSLPYIFDRFYRSDKSRVHSGSVGAGLGLPIAKAIMKAHRGDILVEPNGNLTEFIFVFYTA